MRANGYVPTDPEATIWDVVIVGTGAGGATAGFNLARLGRSVLFLERGKVFNDSGGVTTNRTLTFVPGKVSPDSRPQSSENCSRRITSELSLCTGYGVGGTTSHYSMTLERFRRADFEPHTPMRASRSAALSQSWPIQYEDLAPFYAEAEALYRVRGTSDSLMSEHSALLDPLPPSQVETIIHDSLVQSGLHPYRMHYARERFPGCDGCPAVPCPHDCRNDAGRICALPALESFGAQILPECLVTKLEAKGRSVLGAICIWNGRRRVIRGKIFILALNALSTPGLLLRSSNETFPDGLANSSGMVGRNLMLHVSDEIHVKFVGLDGPLNAQLSNGLAVNDFYSWQGVKLGNIHLHAERSGAQAEVGYAVESGTALFSTIVEDFPYPENRVLLESGNPEEISWQYTYPDELRTRSAMLTQAFAEAIQPIGEISVAKPYGALNRTHMCGTCRFGADPRTSVLDRDNRAHDLDNVYVLDASFFPTSGGINPALTVIANSLRASALIARQW